MVAISMYRGNLHKVSDIPRRWRMPDHNLSIQDFKSLRNRRKRALSRISLNSNPSVNNVKNELVSDQEDVIPPGRPGSSGEKNLVEVKREEEEKRNDFEGTGVGRSDDVDHSGRVEVILKKEADDIPHEDGKSKVVEKPVDTANEKAEVKETAEVPSEVQKRRKEVEDRLQVLNTKKHNLVQILKQILNAEEELKRRSNVTQQGMTATRPSLPLHVDVSNDSGGNNPGGANMEGGETNDAGNHSTQSRTALRLCGASSSSESPLRRAAAFAQCNMVPHPSRGSPRVGPSQPGNPALAAVTVSASGTNYIASSPSPAGSGGTSMFLDSKLQSPWN